MKKSVLFLLTFIMLLCVSISCFANQPYKHPDYNLRTVKEIHITQIDNLEGEPDAISNRTNMPKPKSSPLFCRLPANKS